MSAKVTIHAALHLKCYLNCDFFFLLLCAAGNEPVLNWEINQVLSTKACPKRIME